MLIIYSAVIFILLGIAFLALSTKTERRQVPVGTPVSSVKQSLKKKPIHTMPPAQNREEEVEKKAAPVPRYAVQEHVFYKESGPAQSQTREASAKNQETTPPAIRFETGSSFSPVDDLKRTIDETTEDAVEAGDGAVAAVLYEDGDGIVSFGEGGDSVHTASFNNLKRLCSGKLQIGADALTFRSEKTLYRFDFHRLKEIRGDEKAVLIYPDTMSYPLLIVSPLDKTLASTVIDRYVQFRKDRS